MSRTSGLENPAPVSHALDRGRQFLLAGKWGAAFAELSAADRESGLDAAELEELAGAAHLIGKEAECAELLTRAHQGFLSRGEIQAAVRCAYRLGFTALINGDFAQSGGWFSRGERLLEGQPDCVERGYLILPAGYRAVHGGDPKQAYEAFAQAIEIGERFGDIDLVTLARQGQGRALIRQGDVARGIALLDEAMVAVTAGEVSPIIAGGVYCSVLEACNEVFDSRRAQEWTTALAQWCATQPDIVPYRGHCLVRRAELLQLHGEWADALDEAKRACECLSQPTAKPQVGAAFYLLAELQRLRGDFAQAEESFRQASRWNRGGHPGLAQLRLAEGQIEAAEAAIRRIADEVRDKDPRTRSIVLSAYVDIVLAAGDVAAARVAADELLEIARRQGAPYLRALAGRAHGAVLLAEKDARGALKALRKAWDIWREQGAPYEAARTGVLVAIACGELGDCDAATLELASAQEVFERLGAAPDVALVKTLLKNATRKSAGELTDRELQVLKLVASGKTNKAIAGKLAISEKTVARHISNIFNKLDLSSRAAATAYAYRHKLV